MTLAVSMFMNILYALEGHLEHPFAVDGIRKTGTRTQISVLNHQFKDMQCIVVGPRPREDGAPYLWELFDRKRMRMRIDRLSFFPCGFHLSTTFKSAEKCVFWAIRNHRNIFMSSEKRMDMIPQAWQVQSKDVFRLVNFFIQHLPPLRNNILC
jgi:hypothetical protein